MALSVPSVSWFSLLVFSVDLQHSREEKKKKFKDTINIPINITVNINVNITVYITVYITPFIYITVHNRALLDTLLVVFCRTNSSSTKFTANSPVYYTPDALVETQRISLRLGTDWRKFTGEFTINFTYPLTYWLSGDGHPMASKLEKLPDGWPALP